MEGVSKVDFGKRGEELAGKMMLAKGYRILERNYRWSHLEIDLIAVHDNKLIFAEVKTRTSSFLGEPYVAVNKAKQRLLIKAANAYILKNNCDLESRFDVFSIIVGQNGVKIEHIEDAFHP